MESKKVMALNSFRSGLNCAQSVLTVYAEQFNFDNDFAMNISCGFGGGMGRLQETCGAVTGAFMTLSIYNCRKFDDNNVRKDKTYTMVQEFNANFVAIHKTTKCSGLLNCDLKTQEGQVQFHENNLLEKVCEKCITDAIDILEDMMNRI